MFRGLLTLALMLLFVALCVWAWSGRRKQDFDAAASLPLDDHEEPARERHGEAR